MGIRIIRDGVDISIAPRGAFLESGTVAVRANLPATGNVEGRRYWIDDENTYVAWDADTSVWIDVPSAGPPSPHAIGGAEHTTSTHAALNAKVSDRDLVNDAVTLDTLKTDVGSSIRPPVQNVTALKAIDTTAALAWPDNTLVTAKDDGLYFLDRGSSEAELLPKVVQPTTGVGRWFRVASVLRTWNRILVTSAMSPYTMLTKDFRGLGLWLAVDATAGPVIINVADASLLDAGGMFTVTDIKDKAGTNSITLNAFAGNAIANLVSQVMTTPGDAWTFATDNVTNWELV